MWKNKVENLVVPCGSASLDFCTWKPPEEHKKILAMSRKNYSLFWHPSPFMVLPLQTRPDSISFTSVQMLTLTVNPKKLTGAGIIDKTLLIDCTRIPVLCIKNSGFRHICNCYSLFTAAPGITSRQQGKGKTLTNKRICHYLRTFTGIVR